jgi:stearoyl-CoA desaturase (Delta-9 desaturase)
MSSSTGSTPKLAQTQGFSDGTTDYKPLRSGQFHDSKKVHISDQPLTWANWYQHINWLNTTFIIFVPLVGFVSAYWIRLHPYTALFSVLYYFNTGIGITGGKSITRKH